MKRRTGEKRDMTGLVNSALFLAFLIFFVLIIVLWLNQYQLSGLPVDPENTEYQEFVITKGESYKSIGKKLQQQGLIADGNIFSLKTRIQGIGSDYKAGTFMLSPSMSTQEIMEAIQVVNAKETVRFTIPEGYTIVQTAEKLQSEGIISTEEFYKALDEYRGYYWFLDGVEAKEADPQGKLTKNANRFEGFLFPDTYEIYKSSNAEDILEKMLNRFDALFTADMQEKLKKSGKTVQEIVTIASLIEKECRVDEERPLISSVIYNRLKKGQNLELDCSIQYILGNPKEDLLYKDLEVESPYNLYKNAGLPPGPIANPGLSSIKAALNPENTEYYYYVLKSKSDISHNFAKTYKEFEKYKAEYKNSN